MGKPCETVKFDCIKRPLSNLFGRLALLISRCPWPFVVVPLVVTGLLCIGFVRFEEKTDPEYLYTPTNGPAKEERRTIQRLFPEDQCQAFVSSRKSQLNGYVYLIIQKSDGGNVWTDEFVRSVFKLDEEIQTNIKVQLGNSLYDYEMVCAKWDGRCEENVILSNMNITQVNISYPVHGGRYFIGRQVGGVELVPGTYTVSSAKAFMLSYYTGCTNNGSDVSIEEAWQDEFKNYFLARPSSNNMKIDFVTSLSLEEGIVASTSDIIPKFAITYTVVFMFTAISCLLVDWVRSKPWYAWGGIITIAIVIASALGFCLAIGIPLTATVGSMPFLIVGIGVDDLFVMLASWRSTSFLLPVDERMSESYKDAAVSVTVTSLTNILSFCVGAITVFPSVQIFCLYTGVAVFFAYVYVITIQGAFLHFTGLVEDKNRHCMTCMKATPADEAEGRHICFRMFCVGGQSKKSIEIPKTERPRNICLTEPGLAKLLRCHYGPFLMKWPIKVVAILLLVAYLCAAIYGCFVLQQGLQLSNLSPDNYYSSKYYKEEYAYFNNKYGGRVMFAFTEPIDYHDPSIQQQTFKVISDVHGKTHFEESDDLTEYWLRDYLNYLQLTGRSAVNKTEFLNILRNEFIRIPGYDRYGVDILFNSDKTEIVASRFVVQSGTTSTTTDEKEMMLEAREVADAAFTPLTAFHPSFIYYDQYLVILSNTLQNMGIALACMVVVSLALIPSPLCVVWVTLSIASICTGVVGFMSLWDVSLDAVSMINVIMCIGFSVDYSVHISYHFVVSKSSTRNGKAIEAIGALGMPVIQGAVSTILGVCVLSTAEAYIFRTFFKIMFLVICFGFLHAMVFLPVLLTVFGPRPNPSEAQDDHGGSSSQIHPNHDSHNNCSSSETTLTTVTTGTNGSANGVHLGVVAQNGKTTNNHHENNYKI